MSNLVLILISFKQSFIAIGHSTFLGKYKILIKRKTSNLYNNMLLSPILFFISFICTSSINLSTTKIL